MNVQTIGHRGASSLEPENTIRSFLKAVELGIDAIELDVHLSKDGELIVIHDDTVDRTTKGKGKISDMTLAELKVLDAGKGEKIPTLGEVLDALPPHIILHTELKNEETLNKVLDLIEQKDAAARVILSSFIHHLLAQSKKKNPGVETGIIYMCYPEDPLSPIQMAQAAAADGLHPFYKFVHPETVKAAHAAGLKVRVWSCDDAASIKDALDRNVDGILTNKPDVLVPIIKKYLVTNK